MAVPVTGQPGVIRGFSVYYIFPVKYAAKIGFWGASKNTHQHVFFIECGF
jgi:hypothetical protein